MLLILIIITIAGKQFNGYICRIREISPLIVPTGISGISYNSFLPIMLTLLFKWDKWRSILVFGLFKWMSFRIVGSLLANQLFRVKFRYFRVEGNPYFMQYFSNTNLIYNFSNFEKFFIRFKWPQQPIYLPIQVKRFELNANKLTNTLWKEVENYILRSSLRNIK